MCIRDRHNEAFDIMLDGCCKITDTDTVGDEAGKRCYDGLRCLNETEVLEVCHEIPNFDVDDWRNKS